MNFFKQIASTFQKPHVEFSKFDMSHEHKTTMRFGELVPIFCEEVLPGDSWHIEPNAFVRTMPLLSPMFHKVDLKVRFFFVPNRLIWDMWEPFISSGEYNGKELFVPTVSIDSDSNDDNVKHLSSPGSLVNYFGISNSSGFQGLEISQLPFRAYDLIWQEYFCNTAVQPHLVRNNYDGAKFYTQTWGDRLDINAQYWDQDEAMRKKANDMLMPENVCFEPDYFTSCLPTPLASAPGISIHGGSVTVKGNDAVNNSLYPASQAADSYHTVADIRNAFRLQHFLENSLRTGKRYIEQLMSHFGVESSDSRVQRPEYIGGGKLAVQISEVAATNESDKIQLGDLAGRGLSVGSFGNLSYNSDEHGYIIGVAYVVPHTSYFGGVNRTFLRHERLDYAFPEFATLGEQPVFEIELDSGVAISHRNKIFGYVPRYSEYKQSLDKFSGDMVNRLAFWHLGRNLEFTDPKLNPEFVYINDNARKQLNRVFGVTDPKQHPFYCSFGFSASANRPLPFNPQTIF